MGSKTRPIPASAAFLAFFGLSACALPPAQPPAPPQPAAAPQPAPDATAIVPPAPNPNASPSNAAGSADALAAMGDAYYLSLIHI